MSPRPEHDDHTLLRLALERKISNSVRRIHDHHEFLTDHVASQVAKRGYANVDFGGLVSHICFQTPCTHQSSK